MKIFKLALGLLFAGAVLSSCEKEMGMQVPDDAVAPVLSAPASGGTYTLSKLEEDNDFPSFVFTAGDFKMDVVASYKIEVDEADGDFTYSKVVATGASSPLTIKIGDFNRALLGLGFAPNEAHTLQFRVTYGNHLSSDPITLTVTPYFDADPWGIIGSATAGGWSTDTFFPNYDPDTKEYSITIDLATGDFKFRQPKFDAGNAWKMNFGALKGKAFVQGDGTWNDLERDGDNIPLKSGNYTIKFKYVSETLAQAMVIQNSAGSETNWDGVVVDAVGTGVSADNTNAVADPSGWSWGNKLLADNAGVPSANGAVYTWVWEGVTLEANEGFKLRTENGVAPPANGANFDAGYSSLDAAASSANAIDNGSGNLVVDTKGQYTITLTIDAANGDAKSIKIENYTAYPANLYLVGDFNGWDWGTSVEMIPVHSNPDKFWRIMYLEADKGFKFNFNKAWDGNEKGSTDDTDHSVGVRDFGGSNIGTPSTAGYYMVVIDWTKQQVLINDVQVYMMGDTVGGWTSGVAGNKFTVDNASKTVNFTGDLSAGNLRMYVAADVSGTNWLGDWWQSEFIVANDAIDYRGVGGDQAAVAVTAGNYTISLNFESGDGSVTQN